MPQTHVTTSQPPSTQTAASGDAAARLTASVIDSFEGTGDQRARQLLTCLVQHLHAFAVEVGLTKDEWETGIDFLTRTGHKCDETRQEFILLSDVLGLSMLTEILAEGDAVDGATEATVLGPFHMTQSPVRALGSSTEIASVTGCDELLVYGRVTGHHGEPLAGASVDTWQADDLGFYDVQQPSSVASGSGRGAFTCDSDGWYYFRTVAPAPYPIPTDGPVGELLSVAGRHPYRPAHIHFLVSAPEHDTLTTHIFLSDSPHLSSDAVFAVRSSLVYTPTNSPNPILERFFPDDAGAKSLRVDLALRTALRAGDDDRKAVT